MTQTSTLKDPGLTNLDSVPIVRNTTGEGGGGAGPLRHVNGYATPLAADAAGSTYQYVRVPSNAKIKSVSFESAAQGAGKISLGVYYATDGSSANASSTIANNVVNSKSNLFATDIDCSSAVAKGDYTNQSGNYTADKRNLPLWKACGLTADPGGNFDIVGTVHTTAVTTGTGLTGLGVSYVE
jgi:hypothetical protein